MSVQLTLCGRVTVVGDGVTSAVESLSGKAMALLAYLALEPGPHSRDELAALLWGEQPDVKARGSLRQALTHLRAALPQALRIDRATVELVGETRSDVSTFLRLAAEAPRDAAECRVARFLADLSVRHCPAFDDWADQIRLTLDRRLADVLKTVTAEAIATRNWRDAARHARRWIAIAPTSAGAAGSLMEAQFMAGDRGSALEAFAEYGRRLAEETGEEPERELVELAERIRAAGPTSVRRQATEEWYANAPSFDGRLIGRQRDWDALEAAWARVRSGRGTVVLLEGEVGVGRSRLAGDFLRRVQADGGVVLRGRGYDARGGVALGTVIELVRSALDAPGLAGTDPQWLTDLARAVPELGERFPLVRDAAPTHGSDSWRLTEAVFQMIVALADESPVTLLIDDLQWCDAETCTLIPALVRRLERAPVLWCVTFAPGAVARDAHAARLVRALRAMSQCTVVALRPLSEGEVWELIRSLGRLPGAEHERRLATRIHAVTHGYPFYIIELLKTLFAQGWLAVDPESGTWMVQSRDAAEAMLSELAPTVHDAIAERIACLPDELGAVLIAIAISADGCRPHLLSHMHGISRLRAAALGDQLVERHLAVEEDGVYRCAHPVIARVVRDSLGTSRRREAHRSMALALEAAIVAGDETADAGVLARHAEEGGERSMTYRYAIRAAEAAEARGATGEALSWLDLAASSASSTSEADVVNRTTARLLPHADWPTPEDATSAAPASTPDVRSPASARA